jgi:hypothetical protein
MIRYISLYYLRIFIAIFKIQTKIIENNKKMIYLVTMI